MSAKRETPRQRITIFPDPQKAKDLKRQADETGKTLTDYLSAPIYYGYDFTPHIKLAITYIGPIKQGCDVYRIDVEFRELNTDLNLRPLWYEVWVSEEYVEDEFHLVSGVTNHDLADFGFRYVSKRYKESGDELPKEFGVFISHTTGEKLAKSREELIQIFENSQKTS